jgi:hypothetical protein
MLYGASQNVLWNKESNVQDIPLVFRLKMIGALYDPYMNLQEIIGMFDITI